MIVKTPEREYRLGEKGLPPFDQRVVSWPWGGTPHLTRWSIDALKYPLGTIILDTVDGHPVVAQIQTHDTYGAHPEWGVKLHKGTSVFVPVVLDGSTGKEVAMRDPPDGWGVSTMAGWLHGRFVDRHEQRWGANRGTILPRQGSLSPEERRAIGVYDQGDHMEHWRDQFAK